MFKKLAWGISLLLFASSAFFITNVAAAQPVNAAVLPEVGDLAGSDTEQNVSKNAVDIRTAKLSSEFRNFIETVYTGQANTITGLFVDGQMALDVIQQPANNPGYIGSGENTVTEFKMARDYGSIGMLAHNYLAGDSFNTLAVGQVIYLVFGDGSVQPYTIANTLSYQALQPNSPYSNFVNVDNPEEYLTAADLFYAVYGQEDALVLQTCIENQGLDTWGRLFIIAVPGALPAGSSPM
jgi:hypothetical protein